jgi:3-dehydroquinate synthetase
MMAAAYLAQELGRIDQDVVDLHRRVLQAMELPVSADLDLAALERAWRHDKKYQGGVRFVLLSAIGRVDSGVEAPRPALEVAIKRMAS